MRNKFLFLSAMMTSCILTIASNQIEAATYGQQYGQQYSPAPYAAPTNPNMPVAPNGGRPCYPAGKCNGDPNLIGTGRPTAPMSRPLQINSTEKFTGTVEAINRVSLPNNQKQVQMVLTTDKGNILVILGPADYIDQQKVKFAAGDKITVTGYRVRANGSEVFNAASIQKNGNTLLLLDERRQPVWGYRG